MLNGDIFELDMLYLYVCRNLDYIEHNIHLSIKVPPIQIVSMNYKYLLSNILNRT